MHCRVTDDNFNALVVLQKTTLVHCSATNDNFNAL